MTPTERTMAALKEMNFKVAIVEKFNYHVRRGDGGYGVRQDLFGIIDIIALDTEGHRIIGVQSTGQDFAGHLKKIVEEKNQEAMDWLLAGGRLQLWAWRKVKVKRGGKAMVWKPRVMEITVGDLF